MKKSGPPAVASSFVRNRADIISISWQSRAVLSYSIPKERTVSSGSSCSNPMSSSIAFISPI
jgi:hypothetical protein